MAMDVARNMCSSLLSGVTSWDHPLEDEFRALVESVRAAVAGVAGGAAAAEEEEDGGGESDRSYDDGGTTDGGTDYGTDSDFMSSMVGRCRLTLGYPRLVSALEL